MSSQSPVVNHLAFYVNDLQLCTSFYRDVMGFTPIPEPFKLGRHSWFSIGGPVQLHLIAGGSVMSLEKQNHVCFSVDSVQDFISRLNEAGIVYENLEGAPHAVTVRPDGISQIYFKDPEGRWIEINDAK